MGEGLEREEDEGDEIEEPELKWGNGLLLPVSGVVEYRRRSLRFIDLRGQIADDLLTEYGGVTFGGSSPIASTVATVERLTVERERGGREVGAREGAVDWNHVTYEDPRMTDPTFFFSEAPVFFRRADRRLDVKTYDRVGVRYRFVVPPSVVDRHRDVLRLPSVASAWKEGGIAVRLEGARDGWQVNLSVAWTIAADSRKLSGNADVDQYRLQVPKGEALGLDLGAIFDRAITIGEEFLQEGLLWKDGEG